MTLMTYTLSSSTALHVGSEVGFLQVRLTAFTSSWEMPFSMCPSHRKSGGCCVVFTSKQLRLVHSAGHLPSSLLKTLGKKHAVQLGFLDHAGFLNCLILRSQPC